MSRYKIRFTDALVWYCLLSSTQLNPLANLCKLSRDYTDNHASIPSLSFLQAGCPSCRLTYSVQAPKDQVKQRLNKCIISDGLMHVAAWHRRTPETKFTKFGEEMSIGQTTNHAKFRGDRLRNVRDIRDQIFVLPEKVGQNSPKSLKAYYPLKSFIMPNFMEIGETTLEKSITKNFTPFNILAPQRDPQGQRSSVWVVGYINPPLAACNISSRSDDSFPRYLLPKFVDFVSDPQKNIQ